MTEELMQPSEWDSVQVAIPPRLDNALLLAYTDEARSIAHETCRRESSAPLMEEAAFQSRRITPDAFRHAEGGAGRRGKSACLSVCKSCRQVLTEEKYGEYGDFGIDIPPSRHEPPNLHAAVLSFPARLLTYVKEKCGGKAPLAYKRAGVSRQIYSRIISRDDATVDKRTAMCFCIGLQLETSEAELLMKSAGYAFSGTLPEDRVFSYCLEKKIWNLEDVNKVLLGCGLKAITAAKHPYR